MTTHDVFPLPRPLRALAGKAIERVLNRALRLDPAAPARLDALAGQSVQLRLAAGRAYGTAQADLQPVPHRSGRLLEGSNLALRVSVEDRRLRVGPATGTASLQVRTTPGVVLAMLLDGDHDVAPGKLEIAGDAGLARRLERLLKDYRPDIEAALAGLLGEVAGVPLAQALERGARAARKGFAHARDDAAGWLRDEARLTPSRAEMQDWLDGVDRAAERSERLAQRLVRLERLERDR